MYRTGFFLTLITLTACDPKVPTREGIISKIVEAAPVDAAPIITEAAARLSEETCNAYRKHGRPLAESILRHDWPTFAPMFLDEHSTPADDEAFCRAVIASHNAPIIVGGEHGQAPVFFVRLPSDFDMRPPAARAALVCHEAAHIELFQRIGLKQAIKDYATPFGRLVIEGTAYALGDAVQEKHGVDMTARQARRAARFPDKYKVVSVDAQCVEGYFSDVRNTLRERGGV